MRVLRLDPALDAIVPANPKIFKLAEGFQFTEGPGMVTRQRRPAVQRSQRQPHLLLQRQSAQLSVFRERSGYEGADIAEYGQPGSNGLTFDPHGGLTINQHGNHRVVRIERDGALTMLAERYEGKRLNSPNDLVYRSDGAVYFTDPPFGLPRFDADPRKELPSAASTAPSTAN